MGVGCNLQSAAYVLVGAVLLEVVTGLYLKGKSLTYRYWVYRSTINGNINQTIRTCDIGSIRVFSLEMKSDKSHLNLKWGRELLALWTGYPIN